jgi:hypothetical protein
MAVQKDWLTDAATEISARIGNTERPGPWFPDLESARAWVRATIVKHMPFEQDVAYEKVNPQRDRELRKLLFESRRTHRHCEDSWYCCAKCNNADHGELEGHDGESPRVQGVCNCGAEAWNARVDAVLEGR